VNKLLIAAGGVVAAVVLFVIFRPGDDDDSTSPPPPVTKTTGTGSVTVPIEPPPNPEPEPPQAARIAIVVRGGKPVGGIKRATVAKNKQVVLTVRADVSDEVHVHGYNLMKDVAPGAPAVIRFKSTIPGRFEAELEERGLQIMELTVNP
jgi:hypothetical protein